jgi:predicted dehydrogenase
LWYAREAIADDESKAAEAKKPGANDVLRLGAIGIGSPQSRGLQLANDVNRQKGAGQYVAVCDVDKRHRERAAGRLGKDVAQFHDFRELLDRKDIDAVLIAVPDHWHALIAVAALRRGKHVYCEKPLTLTVAEGVALVKAAKQAGKTFQVGSQQRSDPNFRLACELVRNGRLGKIKTVETRIGTNPTSASIPVVQPPEGLDWDFWLGPAPKVEYAELVQENKTYTRCHYEFRWWYEYSGGKMTDWGAHHNDIAQWGLGMDESGPVAVEGEGTPPSQAPNSYNCHRNFKVTYTYANGAQLVCTSGGANGVKFIGEDGKWIFVTRGRRGDSRAINASDSKLIEEPLPEDRKVKLYVSNDHMGNFFDGIRTGKPTICPAEVGFRSVTVCHIGNIAVRTGKKLRWDAAKFQFDDVEANKWLSREMRAPWKLEA